MYASSSSTANTIVLAVLLSQCYGLRNCRCGFLNFFNPALPSTTISTAVVAAVAAPSTVVTAASKEEEGALGVVCCLFVLFSHLKNAE